MLQAVCCVALIVFSMSFVVFTTAMCVFLYMVYHLHRLVPGRKTKED